MGRCSGADLALMLALGVVVGGDGRAVGWAVAAVEGWMCATGAPCSTAPIPMYAWLGYRSCWWLSMRRYVNDMATASRGGGRPSLARLHIESQQAELHGTWWWRCGVVRFALSAPLDPAQALG